MQLPAADHVRTIVPAELRAFSVHGILPTAIESVALVVSFCPSPFGLKYRSLSNNVVELVAQLTVTLKLPEIWFARASVAVQSTYVSPYANVDPEAGSQTGTIVPL